MSLQNCLIAGPATLYQDNVLHWLHEHSQRHPEEAKSCQIIACIPWHWQSEINGSHRSNPIAQRFRKLGTQLWGTNQVTWRSPTAYDAAYLILRTLDNCRCDDSQSLLIRMHQDLKIQGKAIKGVTGNIQFEPKIGDRVHPPAEIVAVKSVQASPQQPWQWVHLRSS